MATRIIGLDVSKAFLDGYLAGTRRSFRVANDAEGIARLAEELTDTRACLIVMEASGGGACPPAGRAGPVGALGAPRTDGAGPADGDRQPIARRARDPSA